MQWTVSRMLDTLRTDLRAAVQPQLNQAVRDYHVAALNAAQEELVVSYDWPELRLIADVQTKTGERYYDFPSVPSGKPGEPAIPIALADILQVFVHFGTEYYHLDRGIDPALYWTIDSNREEKCGVVNGRRPLRWEIYGDRQFELWPIPGDQCTKVEFQCLRPRRWLAHDDDVPSLDGRLIALRAAANIATDEKHAQQLEGRFQEYFFRLRGRQSSRQGYSMLHPQKPYSGINIRYIRR